METGAEPTAYVIAHVRERLSRDQRVAALDLTVRIVGHDAYVNGAVATAARRDACDDVLRALLPDYQVHNQLVVLDPQPPSAVEEVS